jgi:hypothetical protein
MYVAGYPEGSFPQTAFKEYLMVHDDTSDPPHNVIRVNQPRPPRTVSESSVLADARLRSRWAGIHSPTLLAGAILGLVGAMISALAEHFLAEGGVANNLADGIALLSALAGFTLIGAFLGVSYLAFRGEHPDVGLARLWQHARRRPSPTATPGPEDFHIRGDRRPAEQVADFIRANPASPGGATFKEIQRAFEAAHFVTIVAWLREAKDEGLVRQIGANYFVADVLGG